MSFRRTWTTIAPAAGARTSNVEVRRLGHPYDLEMREPAEKRWPVDVVARRLLLALVAAAALGFAGCGSDPAASPTSASTTSPSTGMPIPGGGLTIREALSTAAEPPLAVTGWVDRSNGRVRLCSGYRKNESNRCLDPALTLKGRVAGKNGAKVTIFGAAKGTTFIISQTVQG